MAKLTLRVGAIGRWPRNRAKCVSKRTHFGTKKQDIRLYLCTRQLTPSGQDIGIIAASGAFSAKSPPARIRTRIQVWACGFRRNDRTVLLLGIEPKYGVWACESHEIWAGGCLESSIRALNRP